MDCQRIRRSNRASESRWARPGVPRDKCKPDGQNLASFDQYRKILNPGEAQRLATQGDLVIIAWENPDGSQSGHIATIRPEGVEGDDLSANSRLPLVNDIGKRVRVSGINGAFGPDKIPDIHYYTPR